MKSSGCLDSSFGTPLTFPKEAFVEEVEMIRSDQLENDLVVEGQFATEKMMQEWGWTQLLDSLERHSTYLNMPCQACWQFQHYITSYMSINKNLNIEDFDSPVHHFFGVLLCTIPQDPHRCCQSWRTSESQNDDEARQSQTMFRLHDPFSFPGQTSTRKWPCTGQNFASKQQRSILAYPHVFGNLPVLDIPQYLTSHSGLL